MSANNFNLQDSGGSGGGSWDSGSDSSSALDVTLEASLYGSAGDMNIEGRVMGKLGVGVNQLTGQSDETILIGVAPGVSEGEVNLGEYGGETDFSNTAQNVIEQYRTSFEDHLSNVRSQLENLSDRISFATGFSAPDNLFVGMEEGRTLWYGYAGQHMGGETPIEYNLELREFNPIKIPVTEEYSISDMGLPDIPVTVYAKPTEAIQSALTSGTISVGSYPAVTLQIPPQLVFEEVPVVDCLSRYSDLRSDIRSFIQDIQESYNSTLTEMRELESVRDRIRDRSPLDSIVDGNFGSLTVNDIRNIDRNGIREMAQRVRSTPSGLMDRVESLRSENEDIKRRIRSRADSETCINKLLSELEPGDNILGQLVDSDSSRGGAMIDEYNNLRGSLIELFDSLDFGGCADRYSGLDSDISDLESRVNDARERVSNLSAEGIDFEEVISNLRTTDPTSEEILANLPRNSVDLQSFRTEVESLRSSVEDELDTSDGCLDVFNSRLDNILSRVKEMRNMAPGIPENVDMGPDCTDVPKRIRNRVSGLETEVQEFTSRSARRVTVNRYSTLVNESNDVESVVRSEVNDDNPCKEKLVARVEDSRGRLKQFFEGVDENLACSQKFSSVNGAIQDFRESVATLDPAQNPSEARSLMDEGQRLLNRVQSNVDESRCKREFANSVKTALENLSVPGERVNIRTIEQIGSGERAKELEDLQSKVDEILSGAEVPEEMPELPNRD